jgi:hypothetical protein
MALKFTEWHYCKKCPEIYIHCFEWHNENFNIRERGIFGLLGYKGADRFPSIYTAQSNGWGQKPSK